MAPLRFMIIWLFVFLQSSVKLIDAVAAVSFQFLTLYTSVQSRVEVFTSQLIEDLRTKYSFTSQQITSIQVSSSPSDRIQVNFDLDIDTRNSMLISQRQTFKDDLLAPNYIFLFANSTGVRETFLVDGDSASVTPSFWDGWHQYAPDILYSVLVGLVLFALFSSAVYCLVTKQKKLKKRDSSDRVNRLAPSTGHSNGINNDGYDTEMTQVYRIKNTEASPIPHRPSIETSLSVIVPPSPETTDPQSPILLQTPETSSLVHVQQPTESQSPSLDEIPPTSPPVQSQQPDRLAQRRSVTTSESPTLNTFMPPPSPSLVRKMVSMYESVRPTPRSSISKPPPSLPHRSQQLDQSPLRISVTPSESPTYYSEKPPPSPKVTHIMTSLQESVRSLPSILGVSTSTTPTSSRRTSIIGPSIYARLLYSSYSVPPKRIYSYI